MDSTAPVKEPSKLSVYLVFGVTATVLKRTLRVGDEERVDAVQRGDSDLIGRKPAFDVVLEVAARKSIAKGRCSQRRQCSENEAND